MHKKATLGLDLAGRSRGRPQGGAAEGPKLTPEELSRSIDIMRNRINKLGVVRAGDPEAGLEPDRHPARRHSRPARRRDADRQDAVLEIYDFEADVTGPSVSGGPGQLPPVASGSCTTSCPPRHALARRTRATPSQWYLFDARSVVKAGPVADPRKAARERDRRKAESAGRPRRSRSRRTGRSSTVPKDTVVVSCDPATQLPDSGARQRTERVLPPQAPHVKDFPSNRSRIRATS